MKFPVIPWLCNKFNQDFKHPKYLVRLCRRLTDFKLIINEAINCVDGYWSEDLIQRVIEEILEGENSGISTYRADTLNPFDVGHALGVIAEGISQNEFRATAKKRKPGCTRGSLIIPVTCLPQTTHYQFTPENNLNFYPANNHHFDLDIGNTKEFATAILHGIHKQAIRYAFIGNEAKDSKVILYRLQAVITYSYCLQKFGNLNCSQTPLNWEDGQDLQASEQIEILQHLAQVELKSIDSNN